MLKILNLSPIFRQILAVVCCNLVSFSYGTLYGWATINFLELQSDQTDYPTGKLTLGEASLVVSILNVGGFIGNFAILPISERIGIKRTIHCLSIPLIISSLLLICAQNVYFLYISRILSGFVGGAIIIAGPTLATDVAFDKIRGSLNSLYDPCTNLGILFSFMLGNYLNCVDQAKIQLVIQAAFVLLFFCFPESPEHHIKYDNRSEAIKSQKFYKGVASVAEKFNSFKTSTSATVENGKAKDAQSQSNSNKLAIKDFLTPQAKRAIFLAFMLNTFAYSSGVFLIITYVTPIFAETGSTMSFVQVATNITLSSIVDLFNRRAYFIWSSFFTAVSFFLFACHSLLWSSSANLQWMPPLFFSLIVISGCLGVLPISYVFTMEIFPTKIRNACVAAAMSFLWTILFLLGTAYPIVEAAIGLSACLFSFGVICLLSAAFGFWFMPETRGKSHSEIMQLLSK